MPAPTCTFFDGAEHGGAQSGLTSPTAPHITLSGTAFTVVTTAAYLHTSNTFTGGRAYRFTGPGYFQFNLPTTTAKDVCFYTYTDTVSSNRVFTIIDVAGGTVSHLVITQTLTTGALAVTRGGTTLTPTTNIAVPLVSGGATWWRFSAVIADAGGSLEIYANGTLVWAFTGDTRNAGNATFDTFRVTQGAGEITGIDDFCAFTSAVAATDEYFDFSAPPTSDVSTALTRSAGATNYETVDETPVSAADFNSLTPAVVGNGDTFGITGFAAFTSATPTAVVAMAVSTTFKRDGTIAGVKNRLKSGVTTYLSAALAGAAVGTSGTKLAFWALNPDGNIDWTTTSAGAVAFGAEAA